MANTPFLDLVKPAGTDRALVSVINSNSDKIDTGVSTLSEQIGNMNISAISSSTTIASLCSSCPAGQHRYYFIADSNTLTDYPSTTRMYRVLLSIHKIDGSNNRVDVELMGKTGSDIPMAFIGVYENGTQYWSQLATKSDVNGILGTYTQLFDSDASSSTTIVVSGSKMIDQYRLLQFELFTESNVVGATQIVDPRVTRGTNVHRIYAGDTSIWGEYNFGSNTKNITINRTSSTTIKLRCFGID